MPDPRKKTLAHELAEIAALIPSSLSERIDAASESISTSTRPLDEGDEAPDFELPDALGRLVRLSERLSQGFVVLTFYRGEWCPFCNLQVRALQAALPTLEAHGASLLAVTPQMPDRSAAFAERERLTFDVLSDVKQTVIAAYGLQFEVTGDLKDLYQNELQTDVAAYNGNGSWFLPVPATFVIDTSGIIRAACVESDYCKRMEPADILAAVAQLPIGTAHD
jgi:peroxiredoxin